MRTTSPKQDMLIISGLVIFSLSVAVTAFYMSQRVSNVLLKTHAHDASAVLYFQLEAMPRDVSQLVHGGGASEQLQQVTQNLKQFTHVVRYEIFSPSGRIAYSSGKIKNVTVPPLEAASLVKIERDSKGAGFKEAKLFSSDDPGKPDYYASALFHIFDGKKQIASALIYVDQRAEMEKLTVAFNIIAAVTAALLLAVLLIPLMIFWFKVRDRRRAEKRIRFLAHYDPLTGLANRVTFNDKLTSALVRSRRTDEPVAVLFLDLDRFKEVNDTIGHAAGDALLVAFSKRLKACVRETDIVSRLSGDEFAVALIDVPTREDVIRPVVRLFEEMSKPFDIEGHAVNCTVSVGIAVAPNDGREMAELLKCADLALYRSKGEGRNTWSFFEPGMDKALSERRRIEDDLRRSIEARDFELHFQPQFDFETGKVTGSEALLRWRHPEKGLLPPSAFIDVAEETGLIVELGEWAIYEACKLASDWSQPVRVAVNVSPTQFKRSNVVKIVEDALAKSGLEASRLEIEITEATLMSDTDKILRELDMLRDMGISVAMDDFGTGYSSLVYLSRFHFDKIKLDKRFTQGLETDQTIRAISNTIVSLGKLLNIAIVAEGVETVEQAEQLREFGCHQVQGFLYGRPMAAEGHAALIDGTDIGTDGPQHSDAA